MDGSLVADFGRYRRLQLPDTSARQPTVSWCRELTTALSLVVWVSDLVILLYGTGMERALFLLRLLLGDVLFWHCYTCATGIEFLMWGISETVAVANYAMAISVVR